MALEIVAGRALAPYVGMSVYTWTVIIAVVLAGLSLGHWLGGWLADRSARPSVWVASGLTGAAATSAICLSLLRLAESIAAAAGPVAHTGLLAIAAFFLPSALAGVLSPLLTKMALDASPPERHGRVVGRMFALGAAGAILGTLLAGLVLISWVGTVGSVLLITLIYTLLSVPFWTGRTRTFAVLAFAATCGLAGTLAPQKLWGSPCREESAYFCIRVDDTRVMGRSARVMALDHLAHGVNDRDDPLLLLSPYVHGVDELVRLRLKGRTPSAFFVGGGAYTLPRAWAARWPDARFLVAEIDPAVTRTARDQFWLGTADGLEAIHEDARAALSRLPPERHFDVIFGDAFHDISVPQHLVTDEFHAQIAARLTLGGVYAMNVVDKLREPRFVLSLARTLRHRFAHVELWLDVNAIRPVEARTTWIVLASDRPTGRRELSSSTGFSRTWVQVPLDPMVREVGEHNLVHLTDDFAPVDRLLRDLLLDRALIE